MGEISNNKNSNSYQKSKCTAESRKQQVKNEARVIDVSIAVFFDGTLNNKYNIEYRIDLQRKLAEQTKKKNSDDVISTVSTTNTINSYNRCYISIIRFSK